MIKFLLILVLISLMTACKTLLNLPEGEKFLTATQAQQIIERTLNLQYKHTPTSVYVTRDCYKVTYTKTYFTTTGGGTIGGAHTIPTTGTKQMFIYYRDIVKFKLYEYPNCYNLVIYDIDNREINKVISQDLNELHLMIFAIKRLQKSY